MAERHTTEFCENGAKAMADDATKKTIGREFFAKYSVDELRQQSGYWLNAQGRIAEPMIWRDGATHYEPIEWSAAFDLVAAALNGLATPDQAAFYTSGKASNESAFLFQLFARAFGTNNLPDCSNMCHESSGIGLKETIGIGKSTVTLDDLERAKCIIVIGQNPGTNRSAHADVARDREAPRRVDHRDKPIERSRAAEVFEPAGPAEVDRQRRLADRPVFAGARSTATSRR